MTNILPDVISYDNNNIIIPMSENIPYTERLVDLNALLDNRSHFLLGPHHSSEDKLVESSVSFIATVVA